MKSVQTIHLRLICAIWCSILSGKIGCAVNAAGFIDDFAGRIKELYISEQGEFYDQDHKLIAKTQEEFFDYLTTVEFDFHPEIR